MLRISRLVLAGSITLGSMRHTISYGRIIVSKKNCGRWKKCLCFPRDPRSSWGSSALSAFHCRIEFTKLDTGIRGSELPIGPDSGSVAPMLPGLGVALQPRPVAHPVRQVAAEGAQLDLSHVQSRAVLGRVMDFETVGDALGLLGRERLVERGRGVGVELVHDQDELFC